MIYCQLTINLLTCSSWRRSLLHLLRVSAVHYISSLKAASASSDDASRENAASNAAAPRLERMSRAELFSHREPFPHAGGLLINSRMTLSKNNDFECF